MRASRRWRATPRTCGYNRAFLFSAESMSVMRGLDPRIHLLEKMDCRVKPGNDS
jgi:hypothetical protein